MKVNKILVKCFWLDNITANVKNCKFFDSSSILLLVCSTYVGCIAQLVEQRTFNPLVLGSNPNVPKHSLKMETSSILYFQLLKQFFMKKGKKAHIEKLLFGLLLKRNKENKNPMQQILTDCLDNSMLFVKLKTKKRGKLVTYKLQFLEKEQCERKAIQVLAQSMKGNSKDSFKFRLENELENLALGKSSLTIKRNEYHDLALKSAPYTLQKEDENSSNKPI